MRHSTDQPVVVLVDDEVQSLAALQRSFLEEPWQVLATREPAQALQWVESRAVSAVICDQRMPEMSGTQLLEEVRRRSPATKRIILTAYAVPTVNKPGVDRSVECVIEKPWAEVMLRTTVRDFIPVENGEGDD
jgi:two-component system, NtrC family, response regulator HupR/HoxA